MLMMDPTPRSTLPEMYRVAPHSKGMRRRNRKLTSGVASDMYFLETHSLSKLVKKLLGAKGIATKSKDATRGSWPHY